MKKPVFLLISLFAYLQVLLTGTVVFQTFVMYPNIFRDPPASLSLSMNFFKEVTPGDFFPPFGTSIILAGILCLIFSYRFRNVFYYLLASVLILFGGDGVLSILYLWPLNTLLFVEGLEKHTSETLQMAAAEFTRVHYIRLLTSIMSSVLALTGLIKAVSKLESKQQ
jgi:uncharacterized membrane protein